MINHKRLGDLLFFCVSFVALVQVALLAMLTDVVISFIESKIRFCYAIISGVVRFDPAVFTVDFMIMVTYLLIWIALLLKLSSKLVAVSFKIITSHRYIKSLVVKTRQDIKLIINRKDLVFTAGFLSPQVFISSNISSRLEANEYKAVIEHEVFHARNYHPLKKLLLELFLFSFPRFIASRIMKSYEELTEIAADDYARKRGATNKEIASAIVKLWKIDAHMGYYAVSFLQIRSRIGTITGAKESVFKYSFLFLLISSLFLFLMITFINGQELLLSCKIAYY